MDYAGEHEVIVVGAGPSGAVTATALAQQGRDVVMIDRREFPRDKICGDAVGLGVTRSLYKLGLQDKIMTAVDRGEFYPLKSMRLVSPKGHSMVMDFINGENGEESYVSPRLYFDAILQQHAIDSGVKFLKAEVKEPLLEEGQVAGVIAQSNGEVKAYRSQVLVGADGVTSTIMRHLRPETGQHSDVHRAVALRAYIDDLELYPKMVEFFLYDEILPGYAWIFPTTDHMANIGLGMRLDIFREHKYNLKKMLKDFLAMPAIRERLSRGGEVHNVGIWQLNFGSQKHLQHAYDGALLVGDAAGFINPLTGGGIHNGIISAILAAETIDEALNQGDVSRKTLRIYEERCDQELWTGMKRSFFYQRLVLHMPFVVDFLVKTFSKRNGLANIFLSKL
ncbi:MAG: NAD(P)/FAD-dependent oxidoreductase [Chloroflexota bacterium]